MKRGDERIKISDRLLTARKASIQLLDTSSKKVLDDHERALTLGLSHYMVEDPSKAVEPAEEDIPSQLWVEEQEEVMTEQLRAATAVLERLEAIFPDDMTPASASVHEGLVRALADATLFGNHTSFQPFESLADRVLAGPEYNWPCDKLQLLGAAKGALPTPPLALHEGVPIRGSPESSAMFASRGGGAKAFTGRTPTHPSPRTMDPSRPSVSAPHFNGTSHPLGLNSPTDPASPYASYPTAGSPGCPGRGQVGQGQGPPGGGWATAPAAPTSFAQRQEARRIEKLRMSEVEAAFAVGSVATQILDISTFIDPSATTGSNSPISKSRRRKNLQAAQAAQAANGSRQGTHPVAQTPPPGSAYAGFAPGGYVPATYAGSGSTSSYHPPGSATSSQRPGSNPQYFPPGSAASAQHGSASVPYQPPSSATANFDSLRRHVHQRPSASAPTNHIAPLFPEKIAPWLNSVRLGTADASIVIPGKATSEFGPPCPMLGPAACTANDPAPIPLILASPMLKSHAVVQQPNSLEVSKFSTTREVTMRSGKVAESGDLDFGGDEDSQIDDSIQSVIVLPRMMSVHASVIDSPKFGRSGTAPHRLNVRSSSVGGLSKQERQTSDWSRSHVYPTYARTPYKSDRHWRDRMPEKDEEVSRADMLKRFQPPVVMEAVALPLELDRTAPSISDRCLSKPSQDDVQYLLGRWRERWTLDREIQRVKRDNGVTDEDLAHLTLSEREAIIREIGEAAAEKAQIQKPADTIMAPSLDAASNMTFAPRKGGSDTKQLTQHVKSLHRM
eukprot:gene17082-23377_t